MITLRISSINQAQSNQPYLTLVQYFYCAPAVSSSPYHIWDRAEFWQPIPFQAGHVVQMKTASTGTGPSFILLSGMSCWSAWSMIWYANNHYRSLIVLLLLWMNCPENLAWGKKQTRKKMSSNHLLINCNKLFLDQNKQKTSIHKTNGAANTRLRSLDLSPCKWCSRSAVSLT